MSYRRDGLPRHHAEHVEALLDDTLQCGAEALPVPHAQRVRCRTREGIEKANHRLHPGLEGLLRSDARAGGVAEALLEVVEVALHLGRVELVGRLGWRGQRQRAS